MSEYSNNSLTEKLDRHQVNQLVVHLEREEIKKRYTWQNILRVCQENNYSYNGVREDDVGLFTDFFLDAVHTELDARIEKKIKAVWRESTSAFIMLIKDFSFDIGKTYTAIKKILEMNKENKIQKKIERTLINQIMENADLNDGYLHLDDYVKAYQTINQKDVHDMINGAKSIGLAFKEVPTLKNAFSVMEQMHEKYTIETKNHEKNLTHPKYQNPKFKRHKLKIERTLRDLNKKVDAMETILPICYTVDKICLRFKDNPKHIEIMTDILSLVEYDYSERMYNNKLCDEGLKYCINDVTDTNPFNADFKYKYHTASR
ncbi:hypothetical protein ACFL1H_00640 [Nanoarchaeota archaeon]